MERWPRATVMVAHMERNGTRGPGSESLRSDPGPLHRNQRPTSPEYAARQDKPLWCFQRHTQQWESVSPREIAFGKGYYDYTSETDYSAVAHPDSIFAILEREFPQKREQMAVSQFETWEQHKDFLLEYMQMMRARFPLAMQQQEAEVRKLRGSRITSVGPDRRSVTVDSIEPRPLPEHAVRNWTISRMLQDVQAGISWMANYDWCLRYTDNEQEPFCTTDQALIVMGTIPDQPMSFGANEN